LSLAGDNAEKSEKQTGAGRKGDSGLLRSA